MRFRDPNSHATFVVETYWRPIQFVDGVADIDENAPYAESAIEFLTRFGYVCLDDPAVSDAVNPYLGVVDTAETNSTGGVIRPEDSYYNDQNRPTFEIPREGVLVPVETTNDVSTPDAPNDDGNVTIAPMDEARDDDNDGVEESQVPTTPPEDTSTEQSEEQPEEQPQEQAQEENDVKDSVPDEVAASFRAAVGEAEKNEAVRDRVEDVADGFASEAEENRRVDNFMFALSESDEDNPILRNEREEAEVQVVADQPEETSPDPTSLESAETEERAVPREADHPDAGASAPDAEVDPSQDVPNPDTGGTAKTPAKRTRSARKEK